VAGTGLTASPSPITGAGTMSLTVPVAIANGGTNATTAGAALTNLGALSLAGGTLSGSLYAPYIDVHSTSNRALDVVAPSGQAVQVGFSSVGSAHLWLLHAEPTAGSFSLYDNANQRLGVDVNGLCYNLNGTWNALSDATLKKDVADYTTSLSAVIQLRPVTFTWIDAALGPQENWGLIAQEVEPVMPELVGEMGLAAGRSDVDPQVVKTVDYGRIIFSVINALKEVSQRLEAIEARLG